MLVEATAVHPDGAEEALVSFEVGGIAKLMMKEMMQDPKTTTPKVSLSFEYSRSGLFQLVSAKLNATETVMEEVEKPKVIKAPKKDDEDSEEKSEEDEASADDDASSKTDEAEPEEPEEPEYKEVQKPHTFSLDNIEKTYHNAHLLSKDQKKAAKKRLEALDKRDKDKKLADEAKNTYEALIYEMRAWLNEEDHFPYIEETAREEFL